MNKRFKLHKIVFCFADWYIHVFLLRSQFLELEDNERSIDVDFNRYHFPHCLQLPYYRYMLLLEYHNSKILLSAELRKCLKRTSFNVLLAAQKKKPALRGKTSEQMQPKQNLSRSYPQIVERVSLVSYASSVLNTFWKQETQEKIDSLCGTPLTSLV